MKKSLHSFNDMISLWLVLLFWSVSLKVECILDMDVAEERYLYRPPIESPREIYGCVVFNDCMFFVREKSFPKRKNMLDYEKDLF